MSPEDHIEQAERYLAASGERRLDEARTYLADDAVFVFPSGRYDSLDELVWASGARYRRIGKVHECWDVAARDDGTVAVYSVGTLFGENVHGVPFSGVRYIDRIVFRDGRIVLQQVWNDLADSGVLERTETD